MRRNFGIRERLPAVKQCSCGAESKLIKRRNFPFGRNSKARTTKAYRCNSCRKELPFVQEQTKKRR